MSKRVPTKGRLSPLQGEILVRLKDGPRSLGDLRKTVEAIDTSVLHSIKGLESEKLVRRDAISHAYSLTSIGRVQAIMLDQVSRASTALKEMEEFWLQHDISGIPDHLLMGIWALDKASVVKAMPTDLGVIHSRYLDLLKASRRVIGVSPIFHPDFAQVMAQILGEGARVNLIVTRQVLDEIKEQARLRDLARYAQQILVSRNLEISIRDGLKVALTVAEGFMSFGLFTLDGAYDYSVDVMSTHPEALEWGRRLFEYYKEDSESIKFSSFF